MKRTVKRAAIWAMVLSLLLSMTAVCGLSFTASAAAVLYSENFNSYANGALPTNWTINSDSGYTDIKVQDGGLVINGIGTDAQTRVFYTGSELTTKGNYIFEADYTILQSDYALDKSSRYSGFIFRTSGSALQPYYYVTTRVNTATTANEFSIRNADNSFKKIAESPQPFNPSLNSTYRIKVVCTGALVQFYMDGHQIFNTTLDTSGSGYSYLTAGSIGFTTSNLKIKIDNITVTETDVVASVQPSLYDTYIPKTDLAAAPAAVTHVTSEAVFAKLTGTKLPTAAIYHLDKNLNITTPDGATKIATLNEALAKTAGKVIPALYLKDTATADALATYAGQVALQDAFLVADDMNVLKYARGKMTKLYGVLYTKLNSAATEADLASMVVNTNTAQGKIIMVDADYVSKADITYMQKRLMNVWVLDDNMESSEIYDNIYKGVNGLVSTDHGSVIYYMECFNTGTPIVIRDPFMYAHRGYSAVAPQNTMPAFYAAADMGADLIEMDVRQTSDGVVVIYHDDFLYSLTDCADTSKTVENSTYAELMQYNVDCMAGFSEKIPTLEQFLEFLKGTDIVGIVELKNYDAKLIPLTAQVIKDMGMEHQVVSIAFGAGQAAAFREALPGVSVGLLANYNASYTTATAVLNWAKNCCLPYNFSFHPNTGVVNTNDTTMLSNVIPVAAVRGFQYQPWTYASQARFDTAYVKGIQGLTTDHLEYDDGYVRSIQAGAKYQLKEGQATAMQALGYTSLGRIKLNCEFVRTGGAAVTFSYSNGKTTASGTGTVYGYLRYKSTTKSGSTYYVISDLFTVVVSANGGTTEMIDHHTSLLPEYVAKWKNSISNMNIDVTRDSRGDVLLNTTGNYPAVDNDCGMYASLNDSIYYNMKVDDCVSIVITLSNGNSYLLQKYMSGVTLNGEDLVGNGKTFSGYVKLSDMIPASDANNGEITISKIRVFNVGAAGSQVILKAIDVVEKIPSPVFQKCDVNGDGSVSTYDARMLMLYALGAGGLTSMQTVVADVNGDGNINTSDARLIMLEALS